MAIFSCFCIFLAKNGVFNTNRTARAATTATLRNELCFRTFQYVEKGILAYAFFDRIIRYN